MRYIIVGPQGAGKSTFGGFLAEALGTKATDTSAWLVEVENARRTALWDRYGLTSDLTGPNSTYIRAWDEKRGRPCRELLVALGDAVNSVGNTFLVDRCFEKGDIAMGVRRKNELAEIRTKYPYAVVIYIDRDAGTEQAKDNLELGPQDADVIVRARSLEGSKAVAERIAFIAHEHPMELSPPQKRVFDDRDTKR